jgi:hypothetical protein
MTPTAPVYRWMSFAACEECGVGAGERCMTPNDEKAQHPCQGRKRRTGAMRVGGACKRGHLVRGTNVLMRGRYEECRECHNRQAAESMARRRAETKEGDG